MNNNVLITVESLVLPSFTGTLKMVESQHEDYGFILTDMEDAAKLAGVHDNYEKLIEKLKSCGASYSIDDAKNLNEYIFLSKGKLGDLYMGPVNAIAITVASLGLLKFKNSLYLYDEKMDMFRNETYLINNFAMRTRAGTKGLDRTEFMNPHVTNDLCHFTVNGNRYEERLIGRTSSPYAGVESYTQLSTNDPSLRLKIWDIQKPNYEIDKLRRLIDYRYKNESIALPLAFVYNEQDQVIGIVMRNFNNATEIRPDRLSENPNAPKIVIDALKQCSWLETHTILHRDINHNILVSENGEAHVIDLDSAQFMSYPATALATRNDNALPSIYKSSAPLFNTLDLDYTMLYFLINAFVNADDLFGLWNEKGFCEIDKVAFAHLEATAPKTAELVNLAHTTGFPPSLTRMIDACKSDANFSRGTISSRTGGTKIFNSKPMSNAFSDLVDKAVENSERGDNGDYAGDRGENDYRNRPRERSTYSEAGYYDEDEARQSVSENLKGTNKPTAIKTKKKDSSFIAKLKSIILFLFFTGTSLSAYNTVEEKWTIFIHQRKWVKPLVIYVVILFCIIVMLAFLLAS